MFLIVQGLAGNIVVKVAVGSTYSAAITQVIQKSVKNNKNDKIKTKTNKKYSALVISCKDFGKLLKYGNG